MCDIAAPPPVRPSVSKNGWTQCAVLLLGLNVAYHLALERSWHPPTGVTLPARKNVAATPRGDEHPLLADDRVNERILATNSSQYTWLGNQWVPPAGVPVFTPRQLQAYYTRRNVLVIGDSTSRRFHATLGAIITADDPDDVPLNVLTRDIDREPCKRRQCCSAADLAGRYLGTFAPPPAMAETWSICREHAVNGTDGNVTRFKFDQMYQSCYAFEPHLWRDEERENPNVDLAGFARDYDLIVVAKGLWELKNNKTCDALAPNGTTPAQRLKTTLDLIERNTPPGLQVAWRTAGFNSRFEDKAGPLLAANAAARDHFAARERRATAGPPGDARERQWHADLALVDWGGVVARRSYGDRRIAGDKWSDHGSHYGAEARTLAVQQLTHELARAELRSWNPG